MALAVTVATLSGFASMSDKSFLNFGQQTPVPLNAQNGAPVGPHAQADLDRLMQHRLLEAAASIDSTLKLIERVERGSAATAPSSNPHAPSSVTQPTGAQNSAQNDPLAVRLKIVWKDGPADELLGRLANQLGMEYKESGRKKTLPMVNLNVQGDSARAVFESIGRQITKDANIVLDRSQSPMVLELRYK